MWLLVALLGLGSAREEGPFYCYEDGHLHRSHECRFFAAVIDAGSTGTRLQLYRFVHGVNEHGMPFHVEEEMFHEVKPGLSSFFSRPSDATKGIEELLAKAKEIVPERLRGRTPITLKATAGLRLLPGDAAAQILSHVSSVVSDSGFACMEDCVGILDGKEEGVFSWFTLNLLLENFFHDSRGAVISPSPSRSVPAFDLGGGSTQVTYWPESPSIFSSLPHHRHDINFFDTHMHLFSRSFLGNGLQSARLGVLRGKIADADKETRSEFSSACFPSDFRLPAWEQSMRHWSVRGDPSYSHSACAREVKKLVAHSNITKLTDLSSSGRPIFLFSYFFDRAVQAGIVGPSNEATTSTLGRFSQAAQSACTRPSSSFDGSPHWLPWQCLDLLYIHSLLTDGYGFKDDQPIVLASTIRGMGVSWAQGLAYSLVDAYHTLLAGEDIDDDDEDNEKGPPPGIEWVQETINATGVALVDDLLTAISRRTTEVLQFFNIVS